MDTSTPASATPTRRVALVIGSLRRESINRRLARALEALAPASLQFVEVPIGELPLLNQDLESELPAPVQAFKQALEGCDAVLFVTPEYNRSIPGPLKNAIDWASRPYGRNSLGGKPAAIAGTSAGQVATAAAQQHLRNVLSMLNVHVMSSPELYLQFTPELIAADGTVTAEKTHKFLAGWIAGFAAWIERLAPR